MVAFQDILCDELSTVSKPVGNQVQVRFDNLGKKKSADIDPGKWETSAFAQGKCFRLEKCTEIRLEKRRAMHRAVGVS